VIGGLPRSSTSGPRRSVCPMGFLRDIVRTEDPAAPLLFFKPGRHPREISEEARYNAAIEAHGILAEPTDIATEKMMWTRSLSALFVTAALLGTSSAWGCVFPSDCAVGSRCLKRGDAVYGVCVGGLRPGNDNDRRPVEKSGDIDKTFGNTCSYDMDCGLKNKCLRRSGKMQGICVARRS